jgi:hypothetical protein
MNGENTLKMWAEVGIWNSGEPALVIMRGYLEDGQLIDSPEVLHDVPLTFPEGYDEHSSDMILLPWEEPLEALGYRQIAGSSHDYLTDSVAFDVEKVSA